MPAPVLLAAVNSQYIHTSPTPFALTRAAESRGCGDMLDAVQYSVNMPSLAVLSDLYQRQPQVAAFSVYIWNIAWLRPLLADLKQLLPQTRIYLGGPEAAGRARDYLQELPIEGIFIGEGEESFPAFLEACREGREQSAAIPGLLRRGREEDFIPAPLLDLGSLPFLYSRADLAEAKAQGKVVYYEASRGCPFGCAFCASAGEPLRERPLDMTLGELPLLAEGGGQIKFIDRTFNARPERAIAITRRLLELYRPGLSWHCEISPHRLPEELLQLWLSAPPGYFHLEIGVQTCTPTALAAIGRRDTWDEAEPAVGRLIEAGNCRVHLDLIAGLPGDEPQSFAASFHRLHQLAPDYLQLGFLKVLPGSKLASTARRQGLVWESQPPYRVLSAPAMDAGYLFGLFQAERMFNALYNRSPEFRPQLLAAAEQAPGGALSLYQRAAALRPGISGLTQEEKITLVQRITTL